MGDNVPKRQRLSNRNSSSAWNEKTPFELFFRRVRNISLQIYAASIGKLPELEGKILLLKTPYTLDLRTGRTEPEKQDIC